MFASVDFNAVGAEARRCVVPSEAVIQTGERSARDRAAGDGKFQPADVETGAEANGQTEIRKGLRAGQKVVISGQFLIDSEASLKGATSRMTDVPTAMDAPAWELARRAQMIAALIRWSIANRFLVLLATLMLSAWGVWSLLRARRSTRLPDLSDVQVIIRTTYPGQAPQIVENQVTYPLTTTMLSVPGAKTVRGYSFFGDSFVYVLFEDGTDLYWARSRVLEYLNQVQARLPAQAQGLARARCDRRRLDLRIRAGRSQRASMDLSQLRALQDWFLKYELKTVPNVAEVATHGRHGAPVPGRARSRSLARLRHYARAR